MLREKIEKAVKEVLASPLESVLPTFLKIKDEKKATVTQSEKEFLSLKQDVELLRRELQIRFEQVREYRPEALPPREAEIRIRRFMEAGMPEVEIVERMRRYRVPTSFVLDRIRGARAAIPAEKPVSPAPKVDESPEEKNEPKA